MAADLTDLTNLERKLTESEVSYSCPTLILAECVLVYIDQNKTSKLMTWLASKFSSCAFINYEQLNMNDKYVGGPGLGHQVTGSIIAGSGR